MVAFESEERGRDLLRKMARLNGVADRVRVLGTCDAESLSARVGEGEGTTVVMDIEWAEADVLDPVSVHGLCKTDILVEVHEASRPGVGSELTERFAGTHELRKIEQEERIVGDFPLVDSRWGRLVPASMVMRCLDEKRGRGMSWLYMRSRQRGPGGVPARAHQG